MEKRTTNSTPCSCGTTTKGCCSAIDHVVSGRPTPRRGCKSSCRSCSNFDGGGRERGWMRFRPFRKVSKVRFPQTLASATLTVCFRLRIKFAQINLSLEGDLTVPYLASCAQTLVLISRCRREVRYETERKQYSYPPDIVHLRSRYALGWDKSILLDGRMIRGAATLLGG